jgi:predicted HTH domain antitoxin
MKMVQATIDLPEDLYLSLSGVGITRDQIVSDSKKLLALKYFQTKILSLGKATELSELSKWRFIEYLSQNNISIRTDKAKLSSAVGGFKQFSQPSCKLISQWCVRF